MAMIRDDDLYSTLTSCGFLSRFYIDFRLQAHPPSLRLSKSTLAKSHVYVKRNDVDSSLATSVNHCELSSSTTADSVQLHCSKLFKKTIHMSSCHCLVGILYCLNCLQDVT